MSPQYTIHRPGQAPLSYSVPFFFVPAVHIILQPCNIPLPDSIPFHPTPQHSVINLPAPSVPPGTPPMASWPLPQARPPGFGTPARAGGSAPPKKLAIFLGFRPLTCTYLFLREEGDGGEGRRGPLHRVNEGTFPAASTARHWRNFPSPGLLTQLV